MTNKITRQNTPGPFQDNIAAMYKTYAVLAPNTGARVVAERFGLEVWQVSQIAMWCRLPKRSGPCPV